MSNKILCCNMFCLLFRCSYNYSSLNKNWLRQKNRMYIPVAVFVSLNEFTVHTKSLLLSELNVYSGGGWSFLIQNSSSTLIGDLLIVFDIVKITISLMKQIENHLKSNQQNKINNFCLSLSLWNIKVNERYRAAGYVVREFYGEHLWFAWLILLRKYLKFILFMKFVVYGNSCKSSSKRRLLL